MCGALLNYEFFLTFYLFENWWNCVNILEYSSNAATD